MQEVILKQPYIGWIAWRNIANRRGKRGLTFMAVVSVIGVAIGVASLIVVLSVMGGFEQDLVNKMLQGQPHLEILSKTAAAGFPLEKVPLEKIRRTFPEATNIEPYVQADVVIRQGKHINSATVFGVDPERQGHLWGFNDAVVEGSMADIAGQHAPLVSQPGDLHKWPGIVLGEDMAISLAAEVGDLVTVISPYSRRAEAALAGATISRSYVVVGVFRTGLFNYDAKWAVVNLPEARRFMPDYDVVLDEQQFVTGLALNFANPLDLKDYDQRVGRLSEDLQALTWQKANSSMLFALKLEKFAMGSVLMLIVVVASFPISGTLMMTVYHRRAQVSLLRSLGMKRTDVAKLYLTHGWFIGGVGTVIGTAFALGVCSLIHYLKFIKLPSELYALPVLPVKFLPSNYLVICLLAWIFSLIAATYPALVAARQEPSAGLR